MIKSLRFGLIFLLALGASDLFAHGERAQQAGLRMRTINWMDVQFSTTELAVNDELIVTGTFIPSEWWPEHMPSPEGKAYLNISSPGPAFVRLDTRINGAVGIRSQTYKLGEPYHFKITLKARIPGEYHLHPILNVQDTGPVIGPGIWVKVTGEEKDFVNTITTLTGNEVDLESVGLKEFFWLHAFWLIVAVSWFFYWFRKLPVIMPRFKVIQEKGDKGGNELITTQDMIVSFGFFLFTLISITVFYIWAQLEHPITTPLQTSSFHVPLAEKDYDPIDVKVIDARYRIPGRSFKLTLDITNNSEKTYRVGEFSTANIRFINSDVLPNIKPKDEDDLMAESGLSVENNIIEPGKTTRLEVYADDALWEIYRLTSLIYDPDSRFAGMLFFYDEDGNRVYHEIGGAMLPVFN